MSEKSEWFDKGRNSVLRENRSGCSCKIDEQDNLISCCQLHVAWRDDALAAAQEKLREAPSPVEQLDIPAMLRGHAPVPAAPAMPEEPPEMKMRDTDYSYRNITALQLYAVSLRAYATAEHERANRLHGIANEYQSDCERAEKRVAALEAGCREIARGRIPEDNGRGDVCAARLAGIARDLISES